MAAHAAKPIDQNNPAKDALVVTLAVVVPFALVFLLGLNALGGIPIFWAPADTHAAAEH